MHQRRLKLVSAHEDAVKSTKSVSHPFNPPCHHHITTRLNSFQSNTNRPRLPMPRPRTMPRPRRCVHHIISKSAHMRQRNSNQQHDGKQRVSFVSYHGSCSWQRSKPTRRLRVSSLRPQQTLPAPRLEHHTQPSLIVYTSMMVPVVLQSRLRLCLYGPCECSWTCTASNDTRRLVRTLPSMPSSRPN